ncbi:hypothetical protein EV659_102135 [Rhodothalassium salexigens DSM 2132]|uniref:Uncharacterized protein n=2 Tax=Rhodothalassium salexigens TaxID=1086 RepID=A0A4R2PPM3_RHOSA|nr:hypothetical protein EV659_102135 [Rhodothalassium salexigens DSM 2132]
MGLILAIGFGVVVATILYRIGAMEESVAAPASTTFTAPADSRLIATHPAGDGRLVLVYALAAGGHLIVFADPETEPETWQTIRLRPATSF